MYNISLRQSAGNSFYRSYFTSWHLDGLCGHLTPAGDCQVDIVIFMESDTLEVDIVEVNILEVDILEVVFWKSTF
jgi:hypothetical protein